MKISDLPVLADAKGNAYIPVVDPDETDPALQNKRIYISTIAASTANFTPYDPATTYNREKPDFVSYNGNVYEYISLTPASGNVPTNTNYWKLASAGQFAHIQNTDTHTTSRIFEIGKVTGTLTDINGDPVSEPTGSVVLAFGRANDSTRRTAIREFWQIVEGSKEYYLQYCLDYTGTGSDVWVDLGGGGLIDDANVSPDTTYSSENLEGLFTNLTGLINAADTQGAENAADITALSDRVTDLRAAFTPIAAGQYGAEPTIAINNINELAAYLLGGTYAPPTVAPVTGATVTPQSDSTILIEWTNPA